MAQCKEYKDKNLDSHIKYMKYYNAWRDYDLMASVLANTGLIIYFVYYEMNMTKHVHRRDPTIWENAMDDPYNKEPVTNFMRMIGLILTLFALFCLVQKHLYKVEWQRSFFSEDKETRLYYRYKEITAEKFDIFQPKHTYLLNESFIIEFVMLAVVPIPHFDMYITHKAKSNVMVHYFLSEFMLSIMAMRLFMLVRTYFNYSIYADCYSKKLFQQYGFGANISFSFKAKLINDP
jgi:hypothetical protein